MSNEIIIRCRNCTATGGSPFNCIGPCDLYHDSISVQKAMSNETQQPPNPKQYLLDIDASCETQLDLVRQVTEVDYGWLEGYHSRDAEVAELKAWKAEAMQVFGEMDEQALAEMLGATIGESCRAVIGRRVPEVLAEIEALREAKNEIYLRWLEASHAEAQLKEEVEAINDRAFELNIKLNNRIAKLTEALENRTPDARILELAQRLVAEGPKASHVSCSETHEIAAFIFSGLDEDVDAALAGVHKDYLEFTCQECNSTIRCYHVEGTAAPTECHSCKDHQG